MKLVVEPQKKKRIHNGAIYEFNIEKPENLVNSKTHIKLKLTTHKHTKIQCNNPSK